MCCHGFSYILQLIILPICFHYIICNCIIFHKSNNCLILIIPIYKYYMFYPIQVFKLKKKQIPHKPHLTQIITP